MNAKAYERTRAARSAFIITEYLLVYPHGTFDNVLFLLRDDCVDK